MSGCRLRGFAPALACAALAWLAVTARAEDVGEIVAYDDVRVEVIAQGRGPLVVMLPSRGRGPEDFDRLADQMAEAGFRVLRPQPRGAGRSRGPMQGLSLHDLARDTAAVIQHERAGPAVIVGHAFGSWVARMTAVDFPQSVRGVVMIAAAAKAYPAGLARGKELSEAVRKSGDPVLSDSERLKSLRLAFFAPGNDARVWLQGWYPDVDEAQSAAGRATAQSQWWSGGAVPLLDLQGEFDPFRPASSKNEMREEFGERVTIAVVRNAGHAVIPEQGAAVAEALLAWIGRLPPLPSNGR